MSPGPFESAQCSSPHMIFCWTSSSRDGMSNGRIPIFIEYSASRAERFDGADGRERRDR